MDMTRDRWAATSAYLDAVFGAQDDQRSTLMRRAIESGLPDIAVSSSVGALLALLTKSVAARTVVEVGTLGGYSGLWLADGLEEGGRLITIETEAAHIEFACREFEAAGYADRVEFRHGPALEVLPRLVEQLGPASVDLIFLDGIKSEYPGYTRHAGALLRPGGLLVADNALGSGSWWIDTPPGTNAERDGADETNRLVAADPGFDAACVPIREGVMIARRRD